jgi:tetratricopeptide (TPR) repeat protein
MTVQQAEQLFDQGRYSEAAAAYKQLLSLGSNEPALLRSAGLALTMAGEIPEGVALSERAAHAMPADPDTLVAHGYMLGIANRPVEAIRFLDSALTYQPNHPYARTYLVANLLTAGKAEITRDPAKAEEHIGRAAKIDAHNAATVAHWLEFLNTTGQRGKLQRALEGLDPNLRFDPVLVPVLQGFLSDQGAAGIIRSWKVTAPGQKVRPTPTNTSQMVVCPNCKQSVLATAPVCPYCRFSFRAAIQNTRKDTHTWQEIAYNIMAYIWCADAVATIALGLIQGGVGMAWSVIVGVVRLAVGVGLIRRDEWVSFIGKIMCYITLLFSGCGLATSLVYGAVIAIVFNLITLFVAGFMVYLINHEND